MDVEETGFVRWGPYKGDPSWGRGIVRADHVAKRALGGRGTSHRATGPPFHLLPVSPTPSWEPRASKTVGSKGPPGVTLLHKLTHFS